MKPENKKVLTVVSESQGSQDKDLALSETAPNFENVDLWASVLPQANLSFVEETNESSSSHDHIHLEISVAQSKVQNLVMNLENSYSADVQKLHSEYKSRVLKFKALKQKWMAELERRQKLRVHVVNKYKDLKQDHILKLKELEASQSELSELNHKMQILSQTSAERYEDDLQKYEILKSELGANQDTIGSLKEEVEHYKHKYNSLGALLLQKKKQIQILQETKKDLEFKNLQFELKDVEKETTSHLSDERNKLEIEVESLKSKIDSYEQRLELRNVQIEKRKQYIDELHDKIENEKNKLAENFGSVLKEKETLIQQNLNLTSEVGRLRSLVAESESNVKNHLRSLEVGEHNRKQLIVKVYELEDRIANLERDNEALSSELRLKDSKIESLERKIEETKKTEAVDPQDVIKKIDFKLSTGSLFTFKEKLKSNIDKLESRLRSDEIVPSYRRELEDQRKHLLDLYKVSQRLQDELKSVLLTL